jgi:ATF/CREB family transcription factor
LNAAKKNGGAPTSNPTAENDQLPQGATTTMDMKTAQPAAVDPFGHHDAADAANGLFMLAKGGQSTTNQFAAVPNQSAIPPQTLQANMGDQNAKQRQSVNVNSVANTTREASGDGSDMQNEQTKPAAKGRGKRNASTKATGTAGNRRKTEDSNQGSNKRTKLNNGSVSTESPSEGESDDEDEQPSQKKKGGESKKMTDEEKRKNFLERNRYALPFFFSPCSIIMNPWLMIFAELRRSNVDNGKSSGLPTFKPRLSCSHQRMTRSRPPLLSCGRKL